MSAADLDAAACAAFLVAAFVIAGLGQSLWLASTVSRRFAWPLDGGRTFRGKRIFGSNKTARGVVVMVPATGAAFATLAAIVPVADHGLWPLTVAGYGALGVVAGAGFMAGELPNSFVKRQLSIAPGAAGGGAIGSRLFLLADRMDSALGMLIALLFVVPVPIPTIVYVLVTGPIIHGAFSVLTFRLGGKARPA
jgi:CDP-2,3-bis-(O-geranylgeranyl)-sn-glycerol synthase